MKYAFRMLIIASCIIAGCDSMESPTGNATTHDTIGADLLKIGSHNGNDTGLMPLPNTPPPVIDTTPGAIITGTVRPDIVVSFAESLVGTPYQYGSIDPAVGFDCSGFITYVFSHFGINVPRASIDFTREGTEVPLEKAKRGDIILFTGTDSTERSVGHMGIVVANKDGVLHFIHSSSGKAHGVVITPLDSYYRGRFIKVIRIFPSLSPAT